ncbi:MAG: hypothetical protein KDJ65_29905 [Anaerolineae bacterium]|nr:hypothetical protein [Anaerolineae bacterium]
MTAVVQTIHNTPTKIVLEFAGAGAFALGWLHSVGGSSRTILEATDRYAAASLQDCIHFEAEKVVSRGVAVAMASAAYQRAQALADDSTPLAGIGCTATIATDRTKRGDHHCWVAAYTATHLITLNLALTKGLRDRDEEEQLVSRLILQAVAAACGVDDTLPFSLSTEEAILENREPVALLDQLLARSLQTVTLSPDGQLIANEPIKQVVMLSGSFNPLHQGHRQMVEVAAQKLGRSLYFELPLLNADKPAIASAEALRRGSQFLDYAPLVYTGAPLFKEKAAIFPNTVFVVGYDTATRLIEPRFYNHDPAEMTAAFEQIRIAGCRFFVAGRLKNDRFLTWRDLNLPFEFHDLFDGTTEREFRVDVSSTELRQQNHE